MRKLDCISAAAVLVLALALAPGSLAAPASPSLKSARKSFERFCNSWMAKLEYREGTNLKKARARRAGTRFVLEYTGYADAPVRCEAKPSGVASNPFIGKLVYHEYQFRRTGPTAAGARSSASSVVQSVEVMEIFRFDGTRWVY